MLAADVINTTFKVQQANLYGTQKGTVKDRATEIRWAHTMEGLWYKTGVGLLNYMQLEATEDSHIISASLYKG